jgi:hypothetical protein
MVFSSATFDDVCLPNCAAAIPSGLSDQDLVQRVRQGFLGVTLSYLMARASVCDNLVRYTSDQNALVQLAGFAYMFSGIDKARGYLAQAIRAKPVPAAAAALIEMQLCPVVSLDVQVQIDRDLPAPLADLKDDTGLSSESATELAQAFKAPDKLVLVRALLRVAYRAPRYARRLLLLAIQNCTDKASGQVVCYIQLALLLLLHTGNQRTFMFHTAEFFDEHQRYPLVLLKPFVECITSGENWCDQRITPAAKLMLSSKVPRTIQTKLLFFLLTYLHRISTAERQRDLLEHIPTGMEIEASALIEVSNLELEPLNNPIIKAQPKVSTVFIYSPLQSRATEPRCSVGDSLAFSVALTNPLAISITLDMIALTVTNAIAQPRLFILPALRKATISLTVVATSVGQLTITGFTFAAGNVTGIHRLPSPLVIEVIAQLPQLIVKRPPRFERRVLENSLQRHTFELVNPSDVPVAIKGISFGTQPPVLTPSSLPIAYPPTVDPPLPEALSPGESRQFSLFWPADRTLTVLSCAIEYGTESFSRRFEMNQELDILAGPHISKVDVLSLDDHDDFEEPAVTLMVVVANPQDMPITVTYNETLTVIQPQFLGTFMISVERIRIEKDDETAVAAGITREHIRKCVGVAVKAKNATLTSSEKDFLVSVLLVKVILQSKIRLAWSLPDGQQGTLPFTHVPIDQDTLLLLQAPPFAVQFVLDPIAESVWNVTCKLDSGEKVSVLARLAFALEGAGAEPLLVAGAEETHVDVPGEFTTAIHCLPKGALQVTGKFYIGDAYFVRRASFPLA